MTTDRTPTPWQTGAKSRRTFHRLIVGQRGEPVAEISIPMPTTKQIINTAHANAAFIVRACNAHDELVAALRDLLDAVQSNHEGGALKTQDEIFAQAGHAAIAALAKVSA